MQVTIHYKVEQFNQFNGASEGWHGHVMAVDIDDGGKTLGETLVALLAMSAIIIRVS